MANEKYFSRSWALLTRDKGWIKPLLVMTAANLVPVAGALGNKGYALEWARLTAWGVDAAPKQKNVDVGACIASGWRGFVVDLVWGLALGLAAMILMGLASVFPGFLGSLIGGLMSVVVFVASALAGIVVLIAEIRAAIYQRIGAGYRINRIFEMIGRDTTGFGKLFLVMLACTAVTSLAGVLLGVILAIQLMPVIIASSSGYYDEFAIASAAMGAAGWIVMTCVLFGAILSFLSVATRLITTTATALWMRQFNVPAWGRSEDPLPGSPTSSSAASGFAREPWNQTHDYSQEPEQPWQQEYPQQSEQVGQPWQREQGGQAWQQGEPEERVEIVPLAHVPREEPAAGRPAPVPEPEQETEPEAASAEQDGSSLMEQEASAPAPTERPVQPVAEQPIPDELVKDVDALYADLYDLIGRDTPSEDAPSDDAPGEDAADE